MSYFNSSNQEGTPAQPTQDQQESFVGKVVAKRGEHWNNPEELAKGYLSAQDHIANLEEQIRQQAEDLQKAKTMEDLLEQARQQTPTAKEPVEPTGGTQAQPDTPDAMSEDQLKDLIKKTLTHEAEEKVASDNLSAVDAKLTEMFGTNVEEEVGKRVPAGMTADQLKDLAAKSPDAFFKLIGEPETKVSAPTTQGSVNTAAVFTSENASEHNWSYYTKLRRENPQVYYSAKVQRALQADRERMGAENFYK